MKKVDQLAVELALLQDEELVDTFRKIISRETRRLREVGLDAEESKLFAVSLTAAAFAQAAKLNEGAADASNVELASLGFKVH